MSKMPGEVICTELIFRIKTELRKVVCPDGHHIPMFAGIRRRIFKEAYRSRTYEHVPSLFHRHILRIGLPVGKRIGSHIMGWEGLGPTSTLTVVEDMVHKSSGEFCIVFQEYWKRRIGYINSSDRSVAVVFLGKEHKKSFRCHH